MNIHIAGRDKPHSCPDCWSCAWADDAMRSKHWRIAKWLPRRCGGCGSLTLTTRPRGAYGCQLTRGDG